MGTVHRPAGGTAAAVRDQAGDAGPDRGDLLDELLDRFDRGDRGAAVGTARQRHLGVFVDVVGDGPAGPGMAVRAAGRLPGAIGDLPGVTPAERGRLACRGPGLLVELLLEPLVLVPEVADGLLQGGDLRRAASDSLAEVAPESPAQ